MNEEIITKEELQWQVVDSWIQEGVVFTDLKLEEIKQINEGNIPFPHWTYEYEWEKDTKLQPWAKEVLESEEKLVLEAYQVGYEVNVISGDTQKAYVVEKTVREK